MLRVFQKICQSRVNFYQFEGEYWDWFQMCHSMLELISKSSFLLEKCFKILSQSVAKIIGAQLWFICYGYIAS